MRADVGRRTSPRSGVSRTIYRGQRRKRFSRGELASRHPAAREVVAREMTKVCLVREHSDALHVFQPLVFEDCSESLCVRRVEGVSHAAFVKSPDDPRIALTRRQAAHFLWTALTIAHPEIPSE